MKNRRRFSTKEVEEGLIRLVTLADTTREVLSRKGTQIWGQGTPINEGSSRSYVIVDTKTEPSQQEVTITEKEFRYFRRIAAYASKHVFNDKNDDLSNLYKADITQLRVRHSLRTLKKICTPYM